MSQTLDPDGFFAALLHSFTGFEIPGNDNKPLVEAMRVLKAENMKLREEMTEREEAAYKNGLGDRARVYEENQLLVHIIAGLTYRYNNLLVQK